MAAEFNGVKKFVGNKNWLGNIHIFMTKFFIPSVVKANHKRGWHLVQ